MTHALTAAETPRRTARIATDSPRARVLCRAEQDAALVLRAFALSEPQAELAQAYRGMADRESEHARRWAIAAYEASGRMPARTPTWLARLLAAAALWLGPSKVAPLVQRLQRWHHRLGDGR